MSNFSSLAGSRSISLMPLARRHRDGGSRAFPCAGVEVKLIALRCPLFAHGATPLGLPTIDKRHFIGIEKTLKNARDILVRNAANDFAVTIEIIAPKIFPLHHDQKSRRFCPSTSRPTASTPVK